MKTSFRLLFASFLGMSLLGEVGGIAQAKEKLMPHERITRQGNFEERAIQFTSFDGVNLKGTLTVPNLQDGYKAVIIVSGSGPQNRDGDMFGHQIYKVLAEYLSARGVAVLRYDERGVGESEGNFNSADLDAFQKDVEAALAYMRKDQTLKISQLGLIGHSLGGVIAPKIAAADSKIDFVVMLAGPGMNGDQLMLEQKAAYERGLGFSEAQILQARDAVEGAYQVMVNTDVVGKALKDTLNAFYEKKYGALLPVAQRQALVGQLSSNEMVGLVRNKPETYLTKVQCSLLALNGDKDFQVPAAGNLGAIEKYLKAGGNQHFKIYELDGFNHLFQEAKTGMMDEYAKSAHAMSPIVLDIVSQWILGL